MVPRRCSPKLLIFLRDDTSQKFMANLIARAEQIHAGH